MRGRKETPPELKVLRGNPGKRGMNERRPRPAPGAPPMPPYPARSAEAKAWRRFAGLLAGLGVLTAADGPALEKLVDAAADYDRARAKLKRLGTVYSTVNQAGSRLYRPRPEVALAKDAWTRVVRMLTEFGLTPVMRSKVSRPDEKTPNDLESRLLG